MYGYWFSVTWLVSNCTLAPQVEGVPIETVECYHELCGAWTREWLLWQGPEAIVLVNYIPILSSERALHIKKPANVRQKDPWGGRNMNIKKSPWPMFASELYRSRDHRLSAKLMPTFAVVISVTDTYGRILGFLGRSRHIFFQAAP
jgi:hypothetical protein